MQNIFSSAVSSQIISRINALSIDTVAKWGKMNVAQMLAHCNVTYELVYEKKHTKPGGLKKFLLKLFVKNIVVNEKEYSKNSRTAPEFLIVDAKNFEEQKNRLVDYITKTQELGEAHFNNKESHSFGPLDSNEWNNMFYKHLDHHLKQFGV